MALAYMRYKQISAAEPVAGQGAQAHTRGRENKFPSSRVALAGNRTCPSWARLRLESR